MDITDASPQRRRLGIERFVSGEESLAHEGVVFWKEPEGSLIVASYSDFIHLENVTPEEAARKIERSKQVLEQLMAESPEFGRAVSGLNHKFEFCFEYGTGAVKVAALEDGAQVYLAMAVRKPSSQTQAEQPHAPERTGSCWLLESFSARTIRLAVSLAAWPFCPSARWCVTLGVNETMSRTIGILLCCAFPLAVSAAEPINDKNWQNHPEIKKVRALYNEVNDVEKAGKFKKESRKCVLYGGSFEIDGVLYKDPNGVVRKYVVEAGSGDSVGKAEYYYDAKGIPRFTYRTRGAYNRTKKWDRIYFDEKGGHLYTNHKQEGPGYPGSDLEDSIENPTAHYAQLCKE